MLDQRDEHFKKLGFIAVFVEIEFVVFAGIGDLNQFDVVIANLQIAATRHPIGQKRRIATPQHLAAGVHTFNPQTDAILDIRPHLIGHTGGTLRSQEQIHALRPPQTRNAFQLIAEIG